MKMVYYISRLMEYIRLQFQRYGLSLLMLLSTAGVSPAQAQKGEQPVGVQRQQADDLSPETLSILQALLDEFEYGGKGKDYYCKFNFVGINRDVTVAGSFFYPTPEDAYRAQCLRVDGTGRLATLEEIKQEYNRLYAVYDEAVASGKKKPGAERYQDASQLHVDPAQAHVMDRKIILEKVKIIKQKIAEKFPGRSWNELTPKEQAIAIDTMYNCGKFFPSMTAGMLDDREFIYTLSGIDPTCAAAQCGVSNSTENRQYARYAMLACESEDPEVIIKIPRAVRTGEGIDPIYHEGYSRKDGTYTIGSRVESDMMLIQTFLSAGISTEYYPDGLGIDPTARLRAQTRTVTR